MEKESVADKGVLMGCFVPPEYHTKVKVCAAKERLTLKEYILAALDAQMEDKERAE